MKVFNYINEKGFKPVKSCGGVLIEASQFYDFHQMKQLCDKIADAQIVAIVYDHSSLSFKTVPIEISQGNTYMADLINSGLFYYQEKDLFTRGDGERFWENFLSKYLGPYSDYIDDNGDIKKRELYKIVSDKKQSLYENMHYEVLGVLKKAFNAFIDIECNLGIGEFIYAYCTEYVDWDDYDKKEFGSRKFSSNQTDFMCKCTSGVFIPGNKFSELELKSIGYLLR